MNTREEAYSVIASEAKQSHHFETGYSSKMGDYFVSPLQQDLSQWRAIQHYWRRLYWF